jgi:hypothetical protein
MPRHPLLIILAMLVTMLTAGAAPAPSPVFPAMAAPAVAAPSFGLNTHLATRYLDPATMNIPADAISDLGVSWVREDMHWHRVQPTPETWDWTFTDAAMRELLVRDINVLAVLGPSVGWATPYPGDVPNDVSYYEPDLERFLMYVRAVVERYHEHIDYWEIWNEPDNVHFWKPRPDPVVYTEMLMRTSALIKEIDPDAKVLIGGFNPFDITFARTVAERGGWRSFDIIAIHPYVDPYGPEDGNLIASADAVRALASRYGQKPIWVTEMGWASGPGDRDTVGYTDEQEQADYLVRSMLLLWQAGVERSFWYMLKDDDHNPYGLFRYGSGRNDFSQQKAVYAALRTLNRETAGATFVERRDLFQRQVLLDFETSRGWLRASQPNGTLSISNIQLHEGRSSAQISYTFGTSQNDYLVFERAQPQPLPGRPYALGAWVYGDGTAHGVKIWLRDAEGELLQYVLGPIGPPGWHFVSTPIGGPVEAGNRIQGDGNLRLDFPASLVALVVDDITDASVGSGTIYVDTLSAISGQEVYNFRLQRGAQSLDILWSPPGTRVLLNTRARRGVLVARDGSESTVVPQNGQFNVNVGSSPMYLWHRR